MNYRDKDVTEQADLLPYDKSAEIPFERLIFGNTFAYCISFTNSISFYI